MYVCFLFPPLHFSLLNLSPLTSWHSTFQHSTVIFIKKWNRFPIHWRPYHTQQSILQTTTVHSTTIFTLPFLFRFPLSAFSFRITHHSTIPFHYQSIVQYSTQTQNNYHRINAESKLKHHSHNTSGLPQHCDCECDCDLWLRGTRDRFFVGRKLVGEQEARQRASKRTAISGEIDLDIPIPGYLTHRTFCLHLTYPVSGIRG